MCASLMRDVRRQDGHHDRQARTISSFGEYWGWRIVILSGTTQTKSCFASERAPLLGLRAESLSRQLRRSAVRLGPAAVELLSPVRVAPGCGSTSEIPERAMPGPSSGLRALVLLDVGHAVWPNSRIERRSMRQYFGVRISAGGAHAERCQPVSRES